MLAITIKSTDMRYVTHSLLATTSCYIGCMFIISIMALSLIILSLISLLP